MILLSKYDAFRWHEKLSTYLKGYFYNENISHEDIIEKMLGYENLSRYTNLFSELNGEFAACRETEDYIFACSDYTRSFPLFYSVTKDEFIISDSPDAIRRILPTNSIDEQAMWELRISGTTFGDKTLYKEIKTLGSGEALFYDKNTKELEIVEYIDFDPYNASDSSPEELLKEMKATYDEAIEESLGHLQDQTIVVPIKNGWWERILMDGIKRLGLKKVILYSYGAKDHPNVEHGRKIAEYYGYPWHMIEYTPIEWFTWAIGKDYKKYVNYSTRYNSVPNIEEYLAIKALKTKNIIPDDAILLNVCFTGFLRGDMLPRVFLHEEKITDKILHKEVLREIASNVKWQRGDYIRQNQYINDIFRLPLANGDYEKKSVVWKFKYAYWKERVGKHSSNSRRMYEMFGYRWRNVQIQKKITDFWSKVPHKMRYQGILQNMYDKTYNQDLLDYLGCDPYPVRHKTELDLMDKFSLKFPDLYRKYEFRKKSNKIRTAYDDDPLLWYNIISRRDFNRMRPEVSYILGVQSIKYIWSFLKENDFEIGG